MIEFVVGEQRETPANRAAALADSLAMVRSVYQALAPRPLNVTLLGVWRLSPIAIQRQSCTPRCLPTGWSDSTGLGSNPTI